jgi:hypothetical protein
MSSNRGPGQQTIASHNHKIHHLGTEILDAMITNRLDPRAGNWKPSITTILTVHIHIRQRPMAESPRRSVTDDDVPAEGFLNT